MTPEEFLKSKGIHSLDTKKRTREVYQWMKEYAQHEFPSRDWLIDVINKVVDENQTLGADNIADGIIEEYNERFNQ